MTKVVGVRFSPCSQVDGRGEVFGNVAMKYELLHISSDRLKDRKSDVARRAFREAHEATFPRTK